MVLTLGLFFGSPIEFITEKGNRYGTLILGMLIAILFLIVFYLFNEVKIKAFSIAAKLLTGFLALFYSYIGLIAIPMAIFSDRYPMWEDIAIYKNSSGEKVVAQFIEVSGSLHDYRKIRIYKEYQNSTRVSLRVPDWKMDGQWEKLDLRDSSQTSIEFIYGKEVVKK